MSKIDELQKAINENIKSLNSLYQQAEGLNGIIDTIEDNNNNKKLKENLKKQYDEIIKTFNTHVDLTTDLISTLKRVLDEYV